jgi:hypothetical protein
MKPLIYKIEEQEFVIEDPQTFFDQNIDKGKVLKQPPKYERMVAWHIYRNAQDVKTQRVGL